MTTNQQFLEMVSPFIEKTHASFLKDRMIQETDQILFVEQNQLIFEVPFFIREVFFRFKENKTIQENEAAFKEKCIRLSMRLGRLIEELQYFRKYEALYMILHEKVDKFIDEINAFVLSNGYVEKNLVHLQLEPRYQMADLFMGGEKLYSFFIDEKYRKNNFNRFELEKDSIRENIIQTSSKIPSLKQEARIVFERIKEEILGLSIVRNPKNLSWKVNNYFYERDGIQYFEVFYKGESLETEVCRYTEKNPLDRLNDGEFKQRILHSLKEQLEIEEEIKKENRIKAFAQKVCPGINVLIGYNSEYVNKKTFEFEICTKKYGWTYLSPNFDLKNKDLKQRFIDAIEQVKNEIFELEDEVSLRKRKPAGPLFSLKPPNGLAEPLMKLGDAYHFMPEKQFVYEGQIVQTFLVKGRDQIEKRHIYKSSLKVTDRKEIHDILNELQIIMALEKKQMLEDTKRREAESEQRKEEYKKRYGF